MAAEVPPGTPPDMARILDRGKLIVAQYGGERPPFFYLDEDGQLVGSDIELAQDIARQLGVEVEFKRDNDSFNSVVDCVAEGEADIAISKLTRNVMRARQVLFSKPYMIQHVVLLTNRLLLARSKAGSGPVAAANAPGVRIGVVDGTVFVGIAENIFPHADLVKFKSPAKVFKAVEDGEVMATLYDEIWAEKTLWSNPELLLNVRRDRIPGFEDELSIAVRPDSPQLLHCINLSLDLLDINYSVEDMMERWRKLPEAKFSPGETEGEDEAEAEAGEGSQQQNIIIALAVVAALVVAVFLIKRYTAKSASKTEQGGEGSHDR